MHENTKQIKLMAMRLRIFKAGRPALALYIYIKPKEMLKLGKNTRLHFN
jgi:hypothetical protein